MWGRINHADKLAKLIPIKGQTNRDYRKTKGRR